MPLPSAARPSPSFAAGKLRGDVFGQPVAFQLTVKLLSRCLVRMTIADKGAERAISLLPHPDLPLVKPRSRYNCIMAATAQMASAGQLGG